MSYRHTSPDFNPQRRSLLRAGTAAAGLSALTPLFSVPLLGAEACQPPIPKGHEPSNGGSCPFPQQPPPQSSAQRVGHGLHAS